MEEKAFRGRWGARRERGEADAQGAIWSGREADV